MEVIRHKLTYGNVSSSDYGIYISGEGVYNAPQRVVELVDVPGRNGALTIDQGHFDNITIEYPCFTFAQSQDEFRRVVNSFKNAMIAQNGYQRLTDDYNPDEYRIALFYEGIEFDPVQYGRAGSFTLTFNCKPQRYLSSGDEEITVSDGDVINNPTLFDSEPLLMVKGYGNIGFNGYNIEVANETIGDVYPFSVQGTTLLMASETREGRTLPTLKGTVRDIFEDGDPIRVKPGCAVTVNTGSTVTYNNNTYKWVLDEWDSTYKHSYTATSGATPTLSTSRNSAENSVMATLEFPTVTFVKGAQQSMTYSGELNIQGYVEVKVGSSGGATTYEETFVEANIPITLSLQSLISYYGETLIFYVVTFGTITYTSVVEGALPEGTFPEVTYTLRSEWLAENLSTSSKSALGDPTYIDCEIGEAYMYSGDSLIGLNAYIDLGSDLPRLSSGANEFVVDGTIEELKLIPKWWQL